MKKVYFVLFFLGASMSIIAQSEWQIRLMPQVAFGGRNTVQRPNNEEGTRIFLSRDFERKNSALFSPRLELEYNYKRHHVIATVALLQEKFEGIADSDIRYDGVLFARGEEIEAKYKFNTYRLGYRYRLVDKARVAFELGATLLVRDAFIYLEDDSKRSRYSNVGVAPLISYYLEWKAGDQLSLLTYGDAFALKVGRAEDIFVGAKYQFTPLISATAGYRLLEGGSDNDKVYTMAAYHYLSLGVGFSF